MDAFLLQRELHKLGRSKSYDPGQFSFYCNSLKEKHKFQNLSHFPKGQLKKS